jgi:hypothetical protein
VDVFTPPIRVCPGKAALYFVLGGRVSTGAALSFAEDEFVLALLVVLLVLHAENTIPVKTIDAKTLIIVYGL